jgi:hypothetical protein
MLQEFLGYGSVCGASWRQDVVEGVSRWAVNPAQKGENFEARHLADRMGYETSSRATWHPPAVTLTLLVWERHGPKSESMWLPLLTQSLSHERSRPGETGVEAIRTGNGEAYPVVRWAPAE